MMMFQLVVYQNKTRESSQRALLPGTTLTAGRGKEADVFLNDPSNIVSRRHLEPRVMQSHVQVLLLGQNGAQIGRQKISVGATTKLLPGEPVSIGDWTLEILEDSKAGVPVELDEFAELQAKDFCADSLGTPDQPIPQAPVPTTAPVFQPAKRGNAYSPETKKEESAIGLQPRWRRGNALFRVPRVMWTETSELAELRPSSKDHLTVEMQAAIERTMVGRGRKTDAHSVSPVRRWMKAVLNADSSEISVTSLGSEIQDLNDGIVLARDWRLLPKREGRTLLTLRLSMLADKDGNETAIDAQALHTSIDITVTSALTRPKRFIRDNWRWLLGSSGIGAIAGIMARLRS